jgi:hypothetical protein
LRVARQACAEYLARRHPDYSGRVVRRHGAWSCIWSDECFRREFFALSNYETSADRLAWAAAWVAHPGAPPVPIRFDFVTHTDVEAVLPVLKRLHDTKVDSFAEQMSKAFPGERHAEYRRKNAALFGSGGGAFGMSVGRGEQMRVAAMRAADLAGELENARLQAVTSVFVWAAPFWTRSHAAEFATRVPEADREIVAAIPRDAAAIPRDAAAVPRDAAAAGGNNGGHMFRHFLLMSATCRLAFLDWHNTK